LEITSYEPVERVSAVSVSGQEIAVTMNDANRIDCSQWQAGVYIVNITISGQTFSKKVLIEP
jgi:hypothetical protein